MKSKISTLLLFFTVSLFAQFPAPVNFNFSYNYIHLYDWGYCNGKTVYGPSYCSSFSWEAPDTTTTTAKFVKYKIYYKPISGQISVIDSMSINSFSRSMGILGSVWVTAVYSNPYGESVASNIVQNGDLPIEVKQIKESERLKLHADSENKTIVIDTDYPIGTLRVINTQGKAILQICKPDRIVSIKNIPTGVYIIELNDTNGRIFHSKIIR